MKNKIVKSQLMVSSLSTAILSEIKRCGGFGAVVIF